MCVLVDTAGRLQNRAELMGELEKMVRVMRKVEPDAPHAVLLVLDATVGQNARQQVEIFGKTAGVTGLVMTKLDGTARGGILVAIAAKFGLPVHFIGVGESVDDLQPFHRARLRPRRGRAGMSMAAKTGSSIPRSSSRSISGRWCCSSSPTSRFGIFRRHRACSWSRRSPRSPSAMR